MRGFFVGETKRKMTIADIQQQLREALQRNKLIKDKHDPYQLWNSKFKNRSVVSFEVVDNLNRFIDVGISRVFKYTNSNRKHRYSEFFEVVPSPQFPIPASGVFYNQEIITEAFDKAIIVYDKNKYMHLYGEKTSTINANYFLEKLQNKLEIK